MTFGLGRPWGLKGDAFLQDSQPDILLSSNPHPALANFIG